MQKVVNVVSDEVAESEFERFVDAMDIDISTDRMSEEDRKSLEETKYKVIKAIKNGSLTVNDNGEPSYTTRRGTEPITLTFYESEGDSLLAMDKQKKTEDVAKLFSSMATITKTSIKTFSKMKMSDLKVCMAVTTLFLAQ